MKARACAALIAAVAVLAPSGDAARAADVSLWSSDGKSPVPRFWTNEHKTVNLLAGGTLATVSSRGEVTIYWETVERVGADSTHWPYARLLLCARDRSRCAAPAE